MSKYTNEIKEFNQLKHDDIRLLLLEKNYGNNDAKSLLVKHYLSKVLSYATIIQGEIDLDIDELINVGACGLMEAINNYNGFDTNELEKTICLNLQNEFKTYLTELRKLDGNEYESYNQLIENKVPYDDDHIIIEQRSVEDMVIDKMTSEELDHQPTKKRI